MGAEEKPDKPILEIRAAARGRQNHQILVILKSKSQHLGDYKIKIIHVNDWKIKII